MENSLVAIAPSVETVVWDMDGTLLDSFGIYEDCLNQALMQVGRPTATQDILKHNNHGTLEESIAGVLHDLGQEVTNQELEIITKTFMTLDDVYISNVDDHLFEDAVQLAERLRDAGKRQIIVTNRIRGADRKNASPPAIVANSRLNGVINDVICKDDGEFHKPHQGVLRPAYDTDPAELGEVLVIGDQHVDAELAANIGCAAILIARHGSIAHIERLERQEDYVTVVSSLHNVRV